MAGNKENANGEVTVRLTNGKAHTVSQNQHNSDTSQGQGHVEENRKCCKCDFLKKISNGLVAGLEKSFYRLGKFVARHPWKFIIVCIIVCGVSGLGLLKWHEETEYVKVWLPRGSRMYDEHLWVMEKFPESIRYEAVIIEDENVLSPQSLNAIYDLYLETVNFELIRNNTFDDICIKAGPVCRVNSLLELWAYNETAIRGLTHEAIYRKVNQDEIISPLYRNLMDLEKILGDIQRDNQSNIIGARATTMFYFLKKNDSSEAIAMDWEKQLITLMIEKGHKDLSQLYTYTARTFVEEIAIAASHDLWLLTAGFSFVFLYLSFTLGKYSLLEHKIFLALSGLFSIALAIIFTYGVGLGTGIMFGPIHQITPFMLLGIGVDDMFVIVESLRQLTPKERQLPVEERIGLTLKHAGVSITVTSVTDIVAFAIGGSTVIPSLSTFCVYAAIGVLALYILQATYFVACVTLDERRIDARRNACLLCYKHSDDYKPGKYYSYSLQHEFMRRIWGPLLTKTPVKVIVIMIAIGLSALNVWSFIQLKHDFDPSMYLPSDSYSQRYVHADRKYFPDDGVFVQMYCGEMDFVENTERLYKLYQRVRESPNVQTSTVDFWLKSFLEWENATSMTDMALMSANLQKQNNSLMSIKLSGMDRLLAFPAAGNTTDKGNIAYNGATATTSGLDFMTKLLLFMSTNEGRVYGRFIRFDNIRQPTKVLASVLTFRHVKCTSSICNIKAMDDMRDLVDNYQFVNGGKCFVYSNPQYMFNETNNVLKLELYRNLALAAVCVFVVTLILIANVWTSVLVFICVAFTVIDVAGTMQFWDISIDTASSVLLILCFGLAVDYSAHVGHTFMTHTGGRNERAVKTLVHIGPAVFSGGFSTFLAFLLLVNSISYGFTLFFRIFTSVVIFGLFHGLVFLPVVLSIIGPEPYDTKFLSPIDSTPGAKYAEVAANQEYDVHLTHSDKDHIQLTEVIPLTNGNVKQCDFWKEYPRQANGDMCNSLGDIPRDVEDETDEDKNKRYSGSYYEQLSNGSLVQIPHPEAKGQGHIEVTSNSH